MTVLQLYSSGDGRVRVKSSARAGARLAGVTPAVVRDGRARAGYPGCGAGRRGRCGLLRRWCGMAGQGVGWWRDARDAGRFVGSEPVLQLGRWDLTFEGCFLLP